jgi:hypothetical protein
VEKLIRDHRENSVFMALNAFNFTRMIYSRPVAAAQAELILTSGGVRCHCARTIQWDFFHNTFYRTTAIILLTVRLVSADVGRKSVNKKYNKHRLVDGYVNLWSCVCALEIGSWEPELRLC